MCVTSSAIGGDNRLVSGDISGPGSGDRRDSVGGTQSHARGGGSGQGAVFSALRNMKGRGGGTVGVSVVDASIAVVSLAAGGAGAEK